MKRKEILIIDDDKDLNKILQSELGKLGYSVATALDGEEGLRLMQQKKPDLVILDIMLPKISGYEVLGEMKKNKETQTIPVVMLTGMGLEEDIQKGIHLGAEYYLVKPLKTKLLIKCIETTLQ
ncbi:MAG TPA: response regulator [Candidatus Omnitrophota bacterium]|nr:response regulator [Candidatus Omnitrophota bacterium]